MASRQRRSGAASAPDVDAYRRSNAVPDAPAGRRRPEDPPVRDPTAYAGTEHFRQRLHQVGRYVTLDDVGAAIERGQLRWNTDDGWRFAVVRDGVRVVVVVADTDTASPVVVTAWTEVVDEADARAAERWTDEDLETIALRGALSERPGEPPSREVRPRAVSIPFDLGGHRVTTDAGEPWVECADCGGRFRTKHELTDRRCRR